MKELLFGGSHLPFWMFAIRAFVLYIALIVVTRWTGHRQAGCLRISDAWAAVLEPTGKLGVIMKESAAPIKRKMYGLPSASVGTTIPVIRNGKINKEGLKQMGKDISWLKQSLDQQHGISDWSQL